MKLKYLFVFALGISAATAFAGEHGHSSLLKKCKKECPEATKDTLSKCLEEKENDPEFKKTACGKAHTKHEAEEKSHAH